MVRYTTTNHLQNESTPQQDNQKGQTKHTCMGDNIPPTTYPTTPHKSVPLNKETTEKDVDIFHNV